MENNKALSIYKVAHIESINICVIFSSSPQKSLTFMSE